MNNDLKQKAIEAINRGIRLGVDNRGRRERIWKNYRKALRERAEAA